MTELKIWWTLIKGLFICQHYASDLTVIRLVEKLEESPDDLYPTEVWMTRSLCKCGETVDQKFAFGVKYRQDTFNSDGLRYEDVK